MNKLEFYTNLKEFQGKDTEPVLRHYGIIGQKWGTRRWQNSDGTFNAEGKIRYFGQPKRNPNGTVFISGSSKTQFDDNEFYRKELPKPIQDKIKDYMKSGKTILVGDAPGIDRQVQDFLKANNYNDVEVYSPGKKTRYSANPEWKVNHVDVPDAEEESGEWLKGKDEAMTNRATEGLAITIEDGAIATRNNIDRLKSQNKGVDVFELKKNGSDDWTEQNDTVNNKINEKMNEIYKKHKPNEYRNVLRNSDLSDDDQIKIEKELNKKLYKENKDYAKIVNNEDVKKALREYIDLKEKIIKEEKRIMSEEFRKNNSKAQNFDGDGTEYWYAFANKDIAQKSDEAYWNLREAISKSSYKNKKWNHEIFYKSLGDINELIDAAENKNQAYDLLKENIGIDFKK